MVAIFTISYIHCYQKGIITEWASTAVGLSTILPCVLCKSRYVKFLSWQFCIFTALLKVIDVLKGKGNLKFSISNLDKSTLTNFFQGDKGRE